MGSPFPVLIILVSYLLIVLLLGPKFMKNRQPYDLKTVIFYYNIFQIIASTMIVVNVSLFQLGVDMTQL